MFVSFCATQHFMRAADHTPVDHLTSTGPDPTMQPAPVDPTGFHFWNSSIWSKLQCHFPQKSWWIGWFSKSQLFCHMANGKLNFRQKATTQQVSIVWYRLQDAFTTVLYWNQRIMNLLRCVHGRWLVHASWLPLPHTQEYTSFTGQFLINEKKTILCSGNFSICSCWCLLPKMICWKWLFGFQCGDIF